MSEIFYKLLHMETSFKYIFQNCSEFLPLHFCHLLNPIKCFHMCISVHHLLAGLCFVKRLFSDVSIVQSQQKRTRIEKYFHFFLYMYKNICFYMSKRRSSVIFTPLYEGEKNLVQANLVEKD